MVTEPGSATGVQAAVDRSAGPVRSRHRYRPAPRFGWDRGVELAVALLLAAGVLVVHDVSYLLNQPFWLDESWVAVSARASLASLPNVTGPSPLGWTALLRVVPGAGPQRTRLVPLAFAALTVLAAYGLGREVRPRRGPPATPQRRSSRRGRPDPGRRPQ